MSAPPQQVPLQYVNPAVVHAPAPSVVVINQQPLPPPNSFFQKDLFSCCDNPGLCMCLTCVPYASCYVSNKVAESVGEGFCCHGFWAAFCDPLSARVRIRGMLRAKYNIQGNCCTDTMMHMFCSPCAIVQEVNEVVAREGANAPAMPCMSRQ